jgi:ferredoxin
MAKVVYKNTNDIVEVRDGENLRQVILDNSWNIPFGCENGVCGTWIIRIVSGIENLSEPSEKELMTLPAMGLSTETYRLACQCSILKGEVEIENS